MDKLYKEAFIMDENKFEVISSKVSSADFKSDKTVVTDDFAPIGN